MDSISHPISALEFNAFPDLGRFFNPRRVAYIGATEDVSKFGGKCTRELIDFGFNGEIYPINPKRTTVFGRKCYSSLRELPEVPDHVGIVLPAAQVIGAIEECGRLGVPFATVFSSGFAEIGTESGRGLQAQLAAAAKAGGVRLMGPNCNGMVNFVERVALTSTAVIRGGPYRRPGDIGVVSHSGGAGQVNIMWRAQEAGLGISYQVSCGNDADLDLLDYAAFMLEDPHTRVVLALAERLSDGEKLRALAARAAALDKAIVMVKVGRSAAGSRAAQSHTGAITGADDICSAALEQFGIMRVDDCYELYEAAMLLRRRQRLRGPRAAATSLSGGNLVMLADLGGSLGIEWPDFAPATQSTLAKLLPGFGAATNPTDLTAVSVGRADIFTSVCKTLHDDPNIDGVIPVLTFAPAADIRSLAAFAATAEKPVAFLWTGKCGDDPSLTQERLVEQGHAVYRDVLPALKAWQTVMQHEMRKRKLQSRAALQRPAGIDPGIAQSMLRNAGHALNEKDSKDLVASYGLRPTREAVARESREAVRLASEFGTAVALKILSADLPHKTDAGAIRLGVAGKDQVSRAFEEVIAAARAYRADARIDGVLVQEMVNDGEELLLGIVRDPVFGPVLTVGLGGIHVEVFKDVALRIPPVSKDDAREMIESLKSFALLNGSRGRPPLDIDALIDSIVRLSWLAVDTRALLAELDINPLRVLPRGQGVRVVDALVVPLERRGS